MNKEIEKEKQAKAGSPIFVLVIFIALIGFLFVVPEIYKRFNNDFASFLGIGKNDKDKDDKVKSEEDKIAGQSAFYQIGSNPIFNYNELRVSEVSLDNTTLLMKLETEENTDLNSRNYYVEFYEGTNQFLGRRILKGKVDNSLNVKLDVGGLNITTVTYFTLSHITDESIPSIDLPTDESSLSDLTCTKNEREYKYEFDDKKLHKVTSKFTATYPNIDEYANELMNYQKKEKNYNEFNGVTASIANVNSTLIFTSEFDYTEISSFNRIDDEEHIFSKDELDKVVKFKMEAEGYDCQ